MSTHLQSSARAPCTVVALVTLVIVSTAWPQSAAAQATLFVEGLTAPAGIYVDDDGFLWVASLGTGADDAGVYVVSPEGAVHPFMTGLPSTIVEGDPAGTNHVYFNNDVQLIVVQGQGTGDVSGSVFTIDTTGFTPGDNPLGSDDIEEVFPVSDFVLGELGVNESNPYAMTFVPSSPTSYVTDAAANAIVEGSDGGLSILATLDDVPNTGSQGPPMVDAVPTGIDYHDGSIYVGTLTGFPFNEGAATIFEIDMQGNVAPLIEDLTTVVDLQVVPGGGGLVFLEHRFGPGAGRLVKWEDGELTELATGLSRPTGMRFGLNGEVYVSLLEEGQIVVVEGVVTAAEREIPRAGTQIRVQTYPNPFSDRITLAIEGLDAGAAELRIVDVLGRTVHRSEIVQPGSGMLRVHWDGRSVNGAELSSGSYYYSIGLGGRSVSGALVKN